MANDAPLNLGKSDLYTDCYSLGNYAIDDYTKALSYDPENVGLWHNLALCKISKEDFKGAETDLSKLISLSPQYTKAYLMRAEVSLKQKDCF